MVLLCWGMTRPVTCTATVQGYAHSILPWDTTNLQLYNRLEATHYIPKQSERQRSSYSSIAEDSLEKQRSGYCSLPEVSLEQLSAKPLCNGRHIGHGSAHAYDLQPLMCGCWLAFRVRTDCCIAQLSQQ